MASDPALWFSQAADLSFDRLAPEVDRDWSVAAGTLDWSCRKTLVHMIDDVFVYATQLASLGQGSWVPFDELRVVETATPLQLVRTFRAVARMFAAVLGDAPAGAQASDGHVLLDPADWAARGAYEVLLHSHDIASGLGTAFEPPAELCAWTMRSPTLWLLDRERVTDRAVEGSWASLLRGSGR